MKKYFAIVSALVLALVAVPAVALAAPSPSNQVVSATQNSVTLSVTGGTGLKVVASDANAAGTPAGANVVASFEVTGEVNGQLTLLFNVGTQYAGKKATVYVQHNDGSQESKDVTVSSDGTFTLTVDKLSIYTVVIDKDAAAATTTKADTSSKSPQTGVSTAAVEAVTAVAVVAAAGCAAVIVRKVSVH